MTNPHQDREFDIIVYGATGYTGRLVAEYLARAYGIGGDGPKWAMAGRSADKLQAVRDEIGAPADTPLIVADADDPASLDAMVNRAKAIITTVGPYQLYGEPLLAACVRSGTGYLDLCGEPAWMRQMIDKYHDAAHESGAPIVFSAGFDSIPFDGGVYMLQQHCQEAFGGPAPRIKGRVRAMQGTFSGGTAASLKATMAAAAKDPAVIGYLADPFSLAAGHQGPAQPKGNRPEFDETLDSWAAPFVMAPINTKNVHRTNALTGFGYGEDFVYDEMVLTGAGDQGKAIAEHMASNSMFGSDGGPKPGEGPSREEREAGFYDVLFVAEMPDGQTARYGVKGDKDPGYGSTSKMIAEAALCMVIDQPSRKGGIWTPFALMGEGLADRLQRNAGLSFAVE
ncbi:MAG: saccharopine dehydrogenase NADP-binding domain-containing protein [Blastomonas sp.]